VYFRRDGVALSWLNAVVSQLDRLEAWFGGRGWEVFGFQRDVI
jgi:hypothetical protein